MWLKTIKGFVNQVHLDKVQLATYQVLGTSVQVSVNEINCPEPDCPPIKTVILVFREGQVTQSITIHKPTRDVQVHDIQIAVDGASAHNLSAIRKRRNLFRLNLTEFNSRQLVGGPPRIPAVRAGHRHR